MADVLVVDDDLDVREVVAAILEIEGHDIRTAGNGAQALEQVERRIPDLIVLDIMMPGMDGWRFLEELYARGMRDRTRIIVMSGSIGHVTRARSASGHVLAKPFEPDELLAAVHDILSVDAARLVDSMDRSDSLARLLHKLSGVS